MILPLKHHPHLKYLNLELNLITNVGALYIADAMTTNTVLETLDLGWNRIGNLLFFFSFLGVDGAIALKKSAPKSLAVLNFVGNALPDVVDLVKVNLSDLEAVKPETRVNFALPVSGGDPPEKKPSTMVKIKKVLSFHSVMKASAV